MFQFDSNLISCQVKLSSKYVSESEYIAYTNLLIQSISVFFMLVSVW